MFETLGFETLTAPQLVVFFALALGAAFGVLAEQTKFCFRRGLVGEDRRAAMGVWLIALAAAVLGTQGAVALGWITFAEHRFLATDLPLLAIIAGGLLFGAGMVLSRGCASRLTVLAGTGNLRAWTVLAVFAITAHATLKGTLAPLRTALAESTVTLSNAALPGHPMVWAGLLGAATLLFAVRSGNRPTTLILAAALGLLVPLGWVGTGLVLFDDFDPIAMESLSFTGPWADTLFWTVASTSIPAGFGAGLIGGVLFGSLISSLAANRFAWTSFTSPRETGRYLAGAGLMGTGGAIAGGCTVGAGLAGVPSLSIAAIVTLAAIAAGGLITNAVLARKSQGSFAVVPAE